MKENAGGGVIENNMRWTGVSTKDARDLIL